jgi:TolA-binding protein
VLGGVVLLRPAGERSALAQLGAVTEAPIYLGQAVRGAATPADSIFAAAMAAYDDRRYGDAAAGLARALAAGVDSAPALFFLGASELMVGRSDEAAAAFRHVQSLGATPYLPEAHYYRAKALLRLGDRTAGFAELAALRNADTPIAGAAAALADSVMRLPRR